MKKLDKIVCVGSAIMDMLPGSAGRALADVENFLPMPGGACANVAVAAAKLNVASAFIGKVGRDAFGERLRRVLKDFHVDVNGLIMDGAFRTTLNFHAKPSAERLEYLFYRHPGADTNLLLSEVDVGQIESAKILHIDSLCLTDDPLRTTTMQLIKAARAAKTIVSFDFNYRDVLWPAPGAAVDAVRVVLGGCDILKLNEDEYRLLCGAIPVQDGLSGLLRQGPRLCVLTRGVSGSVLATGNLTVSVPVMRVQPVDTIGCGDAYIAALLAYLIKEEIGLDHLTEAALLRCGLFADTAASLTATKLGAMPASPEEDEVERYFLARENERM